jgi:hypothetical protein
LAVNGLATQPLLFPVSDSSIFLSGNEQIFLMNSLTKNTFASIQKLAKLELGSDYFSGWLCWQGFLNKDSTVWLDGASINLKAIKFYFIISPMRIFRPLNRLVVSRNLTNFIK